MRGGGERPAWLLLHIDGDGLIDGALTIELHRRPDHQVGQLAHGGVTGGLDHQGSLGLVGWNHHRSGRDATTFRDAEYPDLQGVPA